MSKQLLFVVLSKTKVLCKLLGTLNDNGVKGATVITSTGMASALASAEDTMSFSPFKMMASSLGEHNKTILMVVDEEKIPVVRKIVSDMVGGLDKPNTAFMFAVPITFVDGITQIE